MSGKIKIAFSVVVVATVLTALIATFASMSGIPLVAEELSLAAGVSLAISYGLVHLVRRLRRGGSGGDEE